MPSAVIDVGSNTIRMLIGEVRDNALSRISSFRKITRLAGGIGRTGFLGEENMKKSVSVMKDFSRSASEYGAKKIYAVGTSALREAKNSKRFIDEVLAETGICIEIISGMREAELTAKGIMLGFRKPMTPALIIDIGGGSTEWIFKEAQSPHKAVLCGSLPIGVVKLLERFIKDDPPSKIDISSLNSEIDKRLRTLGRELSKYSLIPDYLIGTGGTVTTLASIDLGLKDYDHEKIHAHIISLQRLARFKESLLSLPLDKRKDIAGLEAGRADLIIPGILLTMKVMEFFGLSEILVSDYGLLEGLLIEGFDEGTAL